MFAVVVRRTRVVLLPIDIVWKFVEPAESLTSWLPLGDRCELVDGHGLGRRQRLHARWGRRSVVIDQLVTEYEPEAALAWRHLNEQAGGRPMPKLSSDVVVSVRLERADPGTRVILTSRNTPVSFFAKLGLRLIAAPRIGRAFDAALENLSRTGA